MEQTLSSLDNQILAWENFAGSTDEDGNEWPCLSCIDNARSTLFVLAMLGGLKLPTRVCIDGEGGISFEWANNDYFTVLNIDKNKKQVITKFENNKIVYKKEVKWREW